MKFTGIRPSYIWWEGTRIIISVMAARTTCHITSPSLPFIRLLFNSQYIKGLIAVRKYEKCIPNKTIDIKYALMRSVCRFLECPQQLRSEASHHRACRGHVMDRHITLLIPKLEYYLSMLFWRLVMSNTLSTIRRLSSQKRFHIYFSDISWFRTYLIALR